MPDHRLPLAGIRVFEPGIALAVPLASRILADFGAEVIKMESAARPEIGRVTIFADSTPGTRYWERGAFYTEANRNKYGLSVDLGTAAGKEIFRKLVKVSDVVVENFTPRVMKNFGLDYEALRQIRPDVIVMSSTGFGHDGPWRNYRAYGFSLEPTTGISHFTGYSDGIPVRSMISYTDTPAAYVGAFAVLAALEHRAMTGEGQWIDLSQYEVGVGFVAEAAMEWQLTGRNGGRRGNRDDEFVPQGAYRCQGDDQWITISIRNDREWGALCTVIGRPELGADPRYATAPGRLKHHDDIDAILRAWSQAMNARDAMERLQAAGVAAGMVLDSREAMFDPQLRSREFLERVLHPPEAEGLGTRIYPGAPWLTSHGRPPIRKAPPTLGEDNEVVLKSLLGLSESDMVQLAAEGVTAVVPRGAQHSARAGQHTTLDELQALGIIRDYDRDYRQRLEIDDN